MERRKCLSKIITMRQNHQSPIVLADDGRYQLFKFEAVENVWDTTIAVAEFDRLL